MIQRHKTAIRRNRLSRPVNLLLESGLLNAEKTFFDYGCGHGQDLDLLEKNEFSNIAGWDPFYRPEAEKTKAEVVNLGYVLNVIEKPLERAEALKSAFSLTEKVLCVSVMNNSQKGYEGEEFSDGFKTKTGTFQKYFDQGEIKNYIEATLNKDAIAVQPGVFFVFRNEHDKLDYLSTRYKRPVFLEVTRLDPVTKKPTRVRVFKPKLAELLKESPFFNDVCEFVLNHGRIPQIEESESFQKLIEEYKSKRKIENIIYKNIDEEVFLDVRARRIEELLVFFALRRFDKGGFPKKSDLPTRLFNDISVFFDNYRGFLKQAEALLFSLGNDKVMREAHRNITIGKVLPDAVYVHPNYITSLPAPVQVKVGVAQALVGVIDECNLIKINKMKEKVSFHCYEDFEKVAHPALLWTTVVDLPKLSTKVWDFETRENPPILHRKETFVGEDFPGYDKFKKLSEKQEKAGLLGHNNIGNRKNWEAFLTEEGYEIKGHQLRKLKIAD